MENSIDVKRIESLEDLENALSRFLAEGAESLDRVDIIHQRIRGDLLQMLSFAQMQFDFTAGMDHGPFPFPSQHPPGEQGSGGIRRCLSEVGKQAHKYQKAAEKIRQLMDSDIIMAINMLREKILELEDYINASMDETGASLPLDDPVCDDPCYLPVQWNGGAIQENPDYGNRNAHMTESSKSHGKKSFREVTKDGNA